MSDRTLVFCSDLALHPPLLRVAEIVARGYGLEGHVVAPEEVALSLVHAASGRLAAREFNPDSTSLKVHFLPARKGNVGRFGFEPSDLKPLLKSLDPSYIWLHAEFWGGIAAQFLRHYRFSRGPRIVAYAAVNHIAGRAALVRAHWPFVSRSRAKQLLLWSRLDGVCASATKSMECAWRMGLPRRVPVKVNFVPVFGPKNASSTPIRLPWREFDAFVVGFAGSLTEQKGWKVLLAAVERLPERFKVVVIGDGEQRAELKSWLRRPELKERACHTGVLKTADLLATYPLLDAFVLPSITTPNSVEQFGCVLAEAMACGVAVIGSDSGAIPETIGDAGLIVPEGDAEALAKAIARLAGDPALRIRAGAMGRRRYLKRYSCEAYAQSLAGVLMGDDSAGEAAREVVHSSVNAAE